MLELVLNTCKECFAFVLSIWQRVELGSGISIFDLIIGLFIVFGILNILARSFGSSGIASGVSATASAGLKKDRQKQMERFKNSNKKGKEK